MSVLGKIKSTLLTDASPLWKIVLGARGVSIGSGFTCVGTPGLNKKRGSKISLGKNVTLCSSGMANPVAEGGRCRLATLTEGAEIVVGDGVGMSSVLVCAARSVVIGGGTQIGGGVMIFDTDFHLMTQEGKWGTDPESVSQPVDIGENCFIGARAIILKGVTIGAKSVVGAGAVVTKNVAPGTVVVGNPASVVKSRS